MSGTVLGAGDKEGNRTDLIPVLLGLDLFFAIPFLV